ncbi:MAG TPA: hypothetical protein DFR83_15870 [Deltaproteobacteria bacterium]|nr:hypothetical protein [Deltaproteobacteria bacterium]
MAYAQHTWMSSDEVVPESESQEGRPPEDESSDWKARVRKWASQVSGWVDALLPVPNAAPVLIPVPVRTRRRR